LQKNASKAILETFLRPIGVAAVLNEMNLQWLSRRHYSTGQSGSPHSVSVYYLTCLLARERVARRFLLQHTKTGKMFQMTAKHSKRWRKYQNFPFQSLPKYRKKLVFLVSKYVCHLAALAMPCNTRAINMLAFYNKTLII
jgi:hypothetical protein